MKKGVMLLKAVFAVILLSGGVVRAQHNMHNADVSGENEMGMTEEKEIKLKVYVCSMDEHKNTAFANPGKCPACGMELVEKEVGKVFICPMEEHQDEMYLKEGKCPECPMDLNKSDKIPENAKTGKTEKKEENPENKTMDMKMDGGM